eukprot:gnl/TRDRNA2_/TRDRNA2_157117_c0_seq2.p1 gnl/TRDRNA2_/TRDRNA2_157117_c0~~gnl/TRDRNA2_/TRDRNA2_157117_c0_seq2.p1  ORF type:complete len:166 (-),score=11.48 gnl/TRDRNA2_/TRDRNA2_157117_c0_seq2:64-561(-)
MVSVSVVGIDGTVVLEKVTLELDDYVQAVRAKVWMKTKDPNFLLTSSDGTVLSDSTSIAESGIKDGSQITVVNLAPGPSTRPIPAELQGFWEFLEDRKVDKHILDMWFLDDLSKMSEKTRATFMDNFKPCESIDVNGPTRSIPHQWEFNGITASGASVQFHWECE